MEEPELPPTRKTRDQYDVPFLYDAPLGFAIGFHVMVTLVIAGIGALILLVRFNVVALVFFCAIAVLYAVKNIGGQLQRLRLTRLPGDTEKHDG
jgi:hypothetical protein